MRAPVIDRRTILRGLLGGAAVSVGLPMLEVFVRPTGTALAAPNAFPRRFGLFFWGNGVLPPKWNPSTEGADWALSEQLSPLAAVKGSVTVVSGMRVQTINSVPHGAGPAGFLSGAPAVVRGATASTSSFSRPTADQLLAAQIGGDTRFRSLEVCVQPDAEGLSYTGPDRRNPPEPSPRALFERLFGGGFVAPGDGPRVDPRLALRRSVLDAVLEDGKRLRGRLGRADQARVDEHFQGIRDLELRLKRMEENPPNLAACVRPEAPPESVPIVDGRPQLSVVSRLMVDLLAMALACDATRVFSLWFTQPVSNVLFPGATSGHHQLTHDEPGDQPQVNKIVQQIVAEYAYLVEKLRSVKEGEGTLLDSCAVLGTTDVSYARQHSIDDYPILIAGSCGGALKQGIHYRSQASENTSKVMLTILRAMGVNAADFGVEAGRVTDGLGAIEA